MAGPHCFGSIQCCFLRWAAVTSAGAPSAGAQNGYVTDAIIQLGVGIELKEGVDAEQTNGCGALCQTFRTPDRIKRTTLSTELCQLDSALIQLMVGGSVITSGGNVMGYELPTVDDDPNDGGVLEVWSTAWDSDSQAVLSGQAQRFHFVFPWSKFSPGQFTLESENFLAFPMEGFSDPNPQVTVNGPYNDWPAYVSTFGGITASGGWFLDSTVPTPACAYATVPAQY